MSYGRSVVPTIGAVLIMDYALFLSCCVVDWERCLDRRCKFSLVYRDAWLGGHGFGVVSVSESVSVINVLDGGSKTMVGFANGSRGGGL
jgi:hypothetical protein